MIDALGLYDKKIISLMIAKTFELTILAAQ